MFLSAVIPRCSLVLDHRGIMGGWEGRSGVLVRNLRIMKVVYWANVSVSCGACSPALTRIKDH